MSEAAWKVEALEHWKQGKSIRAIGDLVGVTHNSVTGYFRRSGIYRDPSIQAERRRNGGVVSNMRSLEDASLVRDIRIRLRGTRKGLVDTVERIAARASAPAPQPPQEIPEEPEARGSVPLMELEPHHCRWPTGHAMFCGRRKRDHRYCSEHMERSRAKPREAAS